ncbi:MAG: DUF3788 domain-containing protein [Eubacteriales bacterium]|nr:DUF3788 domain-containing protein [Eubacteriales bacterium]
MQWQERFPQTAMPSPEEIRETVGDPLWDALCGEIEARWKVKPKYEYSRCAMIPGWNVKYKKRGKALATLYPDIGGFGCLLALPDAKQNEAEFALACCQPALAEQYRSAKSVMGCRWLMLERVDEPAVHDILTLIACKTD